MSKSQGGEPMQPCASAPASAVSGRFGRDMGDRLRTLLTRENLSLEKLAAFSGLCTARLEAIAKGEIVPTIGHLWQIANALGVPFGRLVAPRQRRGMQVLRQNDQQVLSSSEGRFTSRALFPFDGRRLVEFYELTIAAGHEEHAQAHAPGTLESLIVVHGRVEIAAGKEPREVLNEGDAIVFEGDVPHIYRNSGTSDALIYLVMSYVDSIEA